MTFMKRIVVCLLVLIGAAAMSDVAACVSVPKGSQSPIESYSGVLKFGAPCECRDENGDYCPECPLGDWCMECWDPILVIDGVDYFVTKMEIGSKIALNFKEGDAVLVTGSLHNAYCVDMIDIVSIDNLPQGVENISGPVVLDPNQPMYNMLGVPVNADYQGVIIQNGHKFVR